MLAIKVKIATEVLRNNMGNSENVVYYEMKGCWLSNTVSMKLNGKHLVMDYL